MIFEVFALVAQGAGQFAQAITDPPLTWHALYWAITLALCGVTAKLYKDLRQESKEKVELLERVLTALAELEDEASGRIIAKKLDVILQAIKRQDD